MCTSEIWILFFGLFVVVVVDARLIQQPHPPRQPRKTASQSSRVAGICSSRGGDEYSEAQLPPRPTETGHTPPPRTPLPPPTPSSLSTHTLIHFPLDVVESVQHSTGVTPLRPVKASTHHLGPCDQGKAEREGAAAHMQEAKAVLSPRGFYWTSWKINQSLLLLLLQDWRLHQCQGSNWLMRRFFLFFFLLLLSFATHFVDFFCVKVNSQKIDPSIAWESQIITFHAWFKNWFLAFFLGGGAEGCRTLSRHALGHDSIHSAAECCPSVTHMHTHNKTE